MSRDHLQIVDLEFQLAQEKIAEQKAGFDGGGGGGYDPRMEDRVKNLEALAEKAGTRLAAIEQDIGIIKSNYVTKSDLAEAFNSQIKWMVGTAAVLGGTAIVVMTFVLNNAVPKAVSAAPVPQSVVVYAHPTSSVPAQAPPAPSR